MTEKKVSQEEIDELRNWSNDQLTATIWFSDCLPKEFCDALEVEFNRRGLDWSVYYE